jgi:hypothetical protein
MIVCDDPDNCQPYGEHFAHHQAGRKTTAEEWVCPVCKTPLLVVGWQARVHIENCGDDDD